MSRILKGSGSNASKAFKDLFDLWFDEHGNKTIYLQTLEEKGINLLQVCNDLRESGSNASKAFKNFYASQV